MSTKEPLITLESPAFYEKSQPLNSPRSLEALRILGISPEELYPLTFEEYLQQNPSTRNLTQALQEQRYSHFENFRKKNLLLAQSQRKTIIDSIQSKQNQSNNNISISQDTSTIQKHQQEQIEKLKQKQFHKIKQKIDYEVKLAALRKQTEEKQKQLQHRDEQKKLLLLELEKQMKDKDKQRLLKLENHKAKLKREEEQRYKQHTEENIIRAQHEQERMRKEEQKRNEAIQQRIKRDEDIKKKIESVRNNQRIALSAIQKQIEDKENERRRYIERIRSANSKLIIEKMQRNQNKKIIKQDDTVNTALLLEIENKQMKIKERKQRVENEKKEKVMKEQEKRNKQIEKFKEIKMNNDKLFDMQMKMFINDMKANDERIKIQKIKYQEEKDKKYNEFNLKWQEKKLQIEHNEKAFEYQRLLLKKQLDMKMERIEEIKKQKLKLIEDEKRHKEEVRIIMKQMNQQLNQSLQTNHNISKEQLYNELINNKQT